MWPWLLITLLPLNSLPAQLSVSNALAVETSNGPTSAQEADILWKDGQRAYEEARYQDAVNSLQRLVDRYPGSSGYLEAHRLLGRSLMLLGRTQEAIAPLKDYISATGTRAEGLQTRLWLGDAYLKLGKSNEAYLTSLEIEKATQEKNPELYAQSQFLKARALIGLNQDQRAQRVLDSVESTPVVASDTALRGSAARTRIELKLRSCAKYPAPGPMDEGQTRDQFNRRVLCLHEAMTQFKTAAESRESGIGDDAAEKMYEGFAAYSQATRHPPEPPRMKPTDRTARQKAQYLAELSAKLDEDRKKALRETVATLAEWKANASAKAATCYSKLTKEIETLL